MKTVKHIVLGLLGFAAWLHIGISGEMLQVPRKDFTTGHFIYPVLLIASVVYLNWLFRVFLMPLSHLAPEQRHILKQQAKAHYSKSFLAGTVGFGYFLLALYSFGFLSDLRSQTSTPNLAPTGVFLIALGTLAQVRGLVRHLSGGGVKQSGESGESTAPSGASAASSARKTLLAGFLTAGFLALAGSADGQGPSPAPPTPTSLTIAFSRPDDLKRWTLSGSVSLDDKSRENQGGSIKVSPGGVAILKLRDKDESGKVEFWVYDDGAFPQDPKASRAGPRWGLLQGDGTVLAVGILYASYLGGSEGYTATDCDGRDWFKQLFWLGIKRTPAWHKWTFELDPDSGLQLFHNDKEVTAVEAGKIGLKGFSGIAIWGDSSQGRAQTVWVADASVTLGGPVKPIVSSEADPYDEKTVLADLRASRPVNLYSKQPVPPPPQLEDLPLRESVSQFGITWIFAKPVRVGQFVNGDSYVVGPALIRSIEPKPLYGAEIPKGELDRMDKERPVAQRVRNGFMLNPPAEMKVAYDSGVRNYFDPALIRKLPVSMKPGDLLVATISMPKNLVLHAQLRNKIQRGEGDSSPIRTAAVLTCVDKPQPVDAFRPAFCDRQPRNYLARDLNRDLLPKAAVAGSLPRVEQYIRFTQRPWVGTCFFGFEEPVENMPQYGLEYGRVSGITALLLCSDLPSAQREWLLVNYVQIGIDLGGMVRAGHPGWTAWGGHGSGRKLPIVFAGMLLGDESMANINQTFPKASFGEDEQTAYGEAWTGAKVVFAGHSGIDAATGKGRNQGRGNPWGPYEHTPPSQWKSGQNTSESYRRCCTSVGWVAQALALRLMHAEKTWSHDAFFDYVDRWMSENDAAFVKTIKEATAQDHDKEWARQGQAWDAFVNQMWARHRPALQAPTNGWQQPHDDNYYRAAMGGS